MPKVAKQCINELYQAPKNNHIHIDDYWFVEPSCGNGCFYDLLPYDRKIGIDKYPIIDGTIAIDFLDYRPEKDKSYIVVGNPPFGKKASMAVKFINKSSLFADFCGMILPASFTIRNYGINSDYRIIYENKIDTDTYLLPNGEKYKVHGCKFVVYTKILHELDLFSIPDTDPYLTINHIDLRRFSSKEYLQKTYDIILLIIPIKKV